MGLKRAISKNSTILQFLTRFCSSFLLVFLIIQFLGFLCTWGVSLLITCYLWSFSAVLDFSLVYYIYFLCSWINFYVHHKHFHFYVRLSVCRSNWYNTKHIERDASIRYYRELRVKRWMPIWRVPYLSDFPLLFYGKGVSRNITFLIRNYNVCFMLYNLEFWRP